MTDRVLAYGLALLVTGLAVVVMAGLHEKHYRNRRWQMLEARLAVLERIIAGEHE